MKIFMHWDMEGASGLFLRDQTWYWDERVSKQVAREGCDLLMADVNSATKAALDAGVDEIIVSDTHHGGGNIVLERMLADPRVTYNLVSTGFQNGEFRWMPGLDETVDGFMTMAHHAKAGTEGAFLPHTNNRQLENVNINGQSVGEMGMESCFAAHWDIPFIMMHGDESACREAEGMFPGITTAAVKKAVNPELCTGLEPQAAHKLVAERIVQSIENLRAGKCKPFKPALPMTVTIRMVKAEFAEAAVRKMPTIERIDEFTIQGHAERYCDVMKWWTGCGLNMPVPDR